MTREMFFGASPEIFRRARELRKNCTEAERTLWEELRGKPQGIKFRRQHPLGKYILDFYAHRIRLAIEVDGSVHLKPGRAANDIKRQRAIESAGITVMRFTNEEVLSDLPRVKESIDRMISDLVSDNASPLTNAHEK